MHRTDAAEAIFSTSLPLIPSYCTSTCVTNFVEVLSLRVLLRSFDSLLSWGWNYGYNTFRHLCYCSEATTIAIHLFVQPVRSASFQTFHKRIVHECQPPKFAISCCSHSTNFVFFRAAQPVVALANTTLFYVAACWIRKFDRKFRLLKCIFQWNSYE